MRHSFGYVWSSSTPLSVILSKTFLVTLRSQIQDTFLKKDESEDVRRPTDGDSQEILKLKKHEVV